MLLPLGGIERLFIHMICGICFPGELISICSGGIDIIDDGIKCDLCKSTNGYKLKCMRKDCKINFHPICGLENKFIIEPNCMDIELGQIQISYCQEHSMINNSIGNNIKLLLKYRLNLLMLKNIINDLASKETIKRTILRKRQEILNYEFPLK